MPGRWSEVARSVGLLQADGVMSPTIFTEMSALAVATDSANLGQGFPDEEGPLWVREIAVQAILQGSNQYPPLRGIAALREAVSAHQHTHYGISLNPDTEVLVTAGATEALTAAILALTGTGDEVVTLEPFYDSHAAAIAMSGATHKTVPLIPQEDGFRLDRDALRATVNEKTRVILVNTPHNPTGTVLSHEELTLIAEEAERFDAIVITDEVYEHLLYDGATHVPFATLDGMFDRTLTVSSAGKTFSLTGWKIGWITGPALLLERVLAVKQYLTFSGGAPFQPAIARALTDGAEDIATLRQTLDRRRASLIKWLTDAGFHTVRPEGTYFVCADASPFLSSEITDGADFARWLPSAIGVACVPLSAFCREGSATAELLKNWVRFTFVKDDRTLETARERLLALRPS